MWGPQDTTGARGSILICLEQTEETAVLPQSDNLQGRQIPAELKDFFKQINNELAKVVDKEIWTTSRSSMCHWGRTSGDSISSAITTGAVTPG